MGTEDEERDYLVWTQLPDDPESFVEVVKEAFLLEHHCVLNKDIAEELGVHSSRVTQMFHGVGKLDALSIELILSRIEGPEHRRRIVSAWCRERFSVDPRSTVQGPLVGKRVTARTVSRVDRMIRQMRLSTAARLALQAARKTTDVDLKQRLFDRAYFTTRRLDMPGFAMGVVREMAEDAVKRGELRRLAMAHLLRAEILIGLPDCRPDEVFPLYDIAERLVVHQPPIPRPAPLYLLATTEGIAGTRLSSRITFMERGVLAVDEEFLREALVLVRRRTQAKGLKVKRFNAYKQLARIHLLLSETTAAQEAVDLAFDQGGEANLQANESCGLLRGRILRVAEGAEQAIEQLKGVRNLCAAQSDRYHMRLAEYDLARLESNRFPK